MKMMRHTSQDKCISMNHYVLLIKDWTRKRLQELRNILNNQNNIPMTKLNILV